MPDPCVHNSSVSCPIRDPDVCSTDCVLLKTYANSNDCARSAQEIASFLKTIPRRNRDAEHR
jgi:hypothetical protein